MLPFYLKSQGGLKISRAPEILTGSIPTTMHLGLCPFFNAREIPVTVPPVPAPATKTSTFPDEGCDGVDGVAMTSSMISGPVVYS